MLLVRTQSAFHVCHVFTGDSDVINPDRKHARIDSSQALHGRRHIENKHARTAHRKHERMDDKLYTTSGRKTHIKHARADSTQQNTHARTAHNFPLPWK